MYAALSGATVTLASSNSALPDVGDYTETCWSYFNLNLNTPFKVVFFVHQLVKKNFDKKMNFVW
jgi:hypothetical protein